MSMTYFVDGGGARGLVCADCGSTSAPEYAISVVSDGVSEQGTSRTSCGSCTAATEPECFNALCGFDEEHAHGEACTGECFCGEGVGGL